MAEIIADGNLRCVGMCGNIFGAGVCVTDIDALPEGYNLAGADAPRASRPLGARGYRHL